MNRRRLLGFLAAAPAAIAVRPRPADDSPRRWITNESEDYLLNQDLVHEWCKTLPAGMREPRSVEITERGLVTRIELFVLDADGRKVICNDRPECATQIVGVEHRGIRWPATPLVLSESTA